MKTNKLTFVLLFILVFFCIQPAVLMAQQSSWSADNDGWILRKKTGSNKYEKFFAIGLWNVPGYTFIKTNEPDNENSNAKLFLERTKNYNMTFVGEGYKKDYMKGIIQCISSVNFPNTLKSYLDKVPSINSDKVASPYLRAQYIRKAIDNNDPKLKQALDSMINHLCQLNADNDYAWAPIDEISQGGSASFWNWPANVGDIVKERIKNKVKDGLIHTDLMGVGRGNSYLFEQLYLKTHASLPENPPMELLSKEARECVKNPLLGFRVAYDGSPVYDFNKGEYGYKEYDFETLKRLWFENIKICAAGFKNSGDVFGINAFRDFVAYPILSGITVDAIKAGINPNIPVWLYFDGNGYAKSPKVSTEDYVKNVKCQMYTSIVHGATGILFWNDRSKKPEVFDAIAPVVKEMKDNVKIFVLKTVETKADNDLHYVIKQKDSKHKYIIATNTSLTNTLPINVKGVNKKSLKPLEVYVASF